MFDVLNNRDYEFLRPLVTGWVGKIEAAQRARSKWKELSDECLMFYSKSAAAMWDANYSRKFWKNVKAPKFRITINKAFELVAVFGPNLLWDVPHRQVEPKKKVDIPPEIFESDPQLAQLYQAFAQENQALAARDRLIAWLMNSWLNYTPREMPGGGLEGHSELAVIDSLATGRGCLWTRPYKFPSSGRNLTGCFREPPDRLLTDPDFNTIDECKWIALKHTDPHWAVERRFQLPAGSLKNRASLESSWTFGELQGNDDRGNPHRAAGQTNDLVVWYEIWSKTGAGGRMTSLVEPVKDHLEKVVGDYAYLAICPSCPYPLNLSTEALRSGITDADVKQRLSWPIPLWADDRWPVELLDFYPSQDSAWPIPPLAPGMGELKFLNFLIPWLANRIYSSSRDFWAVAGPHFEHYKKYLEEGDDQVIIPTPTQTDDVKKLVQVLQQPETRQDAWKIIELVSTQFDKRVGLTEFAYGRNEDGTQNRTAEETIAKSRAVGVRPEHMQKKVVGWQSRLAGVEAFVARWFVTGEDVEPLLGRIGRMLWEQHIMSGDVEQVARQMNYTVAASSIRRPNRERDLANFQQFSGIHLPVVQAYGTQTGDYTPANFVLRKFGEYHDMDVEEGLIPPKQTNPQMEQLQQAQMEADVQKTQAEAQKATAEAQANPAELKMAELQMEQVSQQQQMQMDAAKTSMDLKAKMAEVALKTKAKQAELAMDAQKHTLDMRQQQQKGQLDLQLQKKQGQQQLQQSKQQSQAKVQAMKAQAKAKPKPKPAA